MYSDLMGTTCQRPGLHKGRPLALGHDPKAGGCLPAGLRHPVAEFGEPADRGIHRPRSFFRIPGNQRPVDLIHFPGLEHGRDMSSGVLALRKKHDTGGAQIEAVDHPCRLIHAVGFQISLHGVLHRPLQLIGSALAVHSSSLVNGKVIMILTDHVGRRIAQFDATFRLHYPEGDLITFAERAGGNPDQSAGNHTAAPVDDPADIPFGDPGEKRLCPVIEPHAGQFRSCLRLEDHPLLPSARKSMAIVLPSLIRPSRAI